jgi:hypothetical protein
MADHSKQMRHQTWAAGYADGYVAGLEEAWARVNAEIEGGQLSPDQEQHRKGLVLACKIIAGQRS